MPAIYTSIPVICYDILLVVLAASTLVKHLKEQRKIKMRPNTYVLMIVRYHVIYFVLYVRLFVGSVAIQINGSSNSARNLTNQILQTVLWANVSV